MNIAIEKIYNSPYEFCVIPNTKGRNPCYDIYIEISNLKELVDNQILTDEIEKQLGLTSELYSSYRKCGFLERMNVKIVKKGSFEKIVELKMKHGASKNQVKNTLVVSNGSLNETILLENIIE